MLRPYLFLVILLIGCRTPPEPDNSEGSGGIEFTIHREVTNADGAVEQELIALWKNYLLDGKFQDPASPYWSFAEMKVPDESLWAVGIPYFNSRSSKVQCTIIGIFEAEHDHWSLVSSFAHVDSTGRAHLDCITAVYAKQVEGRYLLISSAEYLKTVFAHHRVGSIDYYVHPFHDFKQEEADRMNAFNQELAMAFGVKPLSFDYFVASNARDITRTWGYEYMDRMYNPTGKGGIASWRNNIIYSGNNSSYFPHELVHLYTYHVVPRDPHIWVGEGIATFYGGAADHSLDWHLHKLKAFLHEHPDFDLSDVAKLKMDIPNGENTSDLRYVIGGLLMQKIHAKEGVPGLVAALDHGTSDDDFHRLIEEKLGVAKADFDRYVKEEMKRYPED